MDHWRQLDKAGQQQQQQQQKPLQQPQQTYQHNKYQVKSTSTNPEQPIPNPIQSIANVLNQHSKFVKNQKKSQQLEEQERDKNKLEQQARGSSTADDHLQQQQQPQTQALKQNSGITLSSSSYDTSDSPVAHTFSQVDQGNSYLYAYNDFVTSNRASNKDHFVNSTNYQGVSSSNLRKKIIGNNGEEIHSSLCNHIPSTSNLPGSYNQETLIDSDEDDALSYILHQHRAPETDVLNEIRCLNFTDPAENLSFKQQQQQQRQSSKRKQAQLLPQYESNGPNSFEAQTIEHHLSCSRSSHPRHICGIGGSHSDKLNHIAARLREESQKAFVLNQRPRNSYHEITSSHLSNELAAIQTQQFTHDLRVIHNQLASSHLVATQQEFNEELGKDSPNDSDLSAELHLASSGAIENSIAVGSQALLLNSGGKGLTNSEILNDTSSSSDQNIPQNLLPQNRIRTRRQERQGYLSWLFCCLCNIFGSTSQTAIKQHSNLKHPTFLTHNLSSNVCKRGAGGRLKRQGERDTAATESSIVSMYSSSQQVAGGQAGAYYATQTPQVDTATMHHYTNHHHYPLSPDSSLGSSAFANSALRMNNFFRSCCSKKCLSIFCLVLIMFIFIFVIGISVYLNFLINSNKTNLIPLSGRLKVETPGDTFNDRLMNRTSKEFLAKQQQYETILRGAFDRTQNLLKSYPNHLVKSEVYSFKQGSLWVYFRLFVNKRTLMLDTQLMKRRAPDEQFDKQFLPRLTQQTLHSGFEQLITAFSKESPTPPERRSSRPSQSAELRQARALPEQNARIAMTQRDHVKSFDDQISRLMPLIESIDLQSIQVTPEFDMLQSMGAGSDPAPSKSGFVANQPFITSPNTVMVATGSNNKNAAEYDVSQPTTDISSPSSTSLPSVPSSSPKSTLGPELSLQSSTQGVTPDEINVTTKKFTLFDYKENVTRPTTSIRPSVATQETSTRGSNSTFFVNARLKPERISTSQAPARSSGAATQSNTLKDIAASRPATDSAQPTLTNHADDSSRDKVQLISGQPVVSQNNFQRANGQAGRNNINDERPSSSNRTSITLFPPLQKLDQSPPSSNLSPLATGAHSARSNQQKDKSVNETAVMQMVAQLQKIEFTTPSLEGGGAENSGAHHRAKSTLAQDTSIQDLWNSALGNNKKNAPIRSQDSRSEGNEQAGNQKRLLTVTTIGDTDGNREFSASNGSSRLDWNKISATSTEISSSNRAQLNLPNPVGTSAATAASSVLGASQKPKVSPHLKQGGSIISSSARQQQQQQQEPPASAVVLNKDFQLASEGSTVGGNSTTSQQQAPATRSTQQRKPNATSAQRNSTINSESRKPRPSKPIIKQKPKKVADTLQQVGSKNETAANGTLINSKGIRIVDNFTASLDAASLNKLAQSINATNGLLVAGSRQNKTKTQEAFNFNADHLAPTLPTTIELTRSTSAFPTRSTEPHFKESDGSNDQRAASNVDYTTTSSVSQKSTTPIAVLVMTPTATPKPFVSTSSINLLSNGSLKVSGAPYSVDRHSTFANQQTVLSNSQIARPGTTNFSNQWKPIANQSNEESWTRQNDTTTTTRQPNLAIIISPERLTPIVNAPSNQGSQSPFAMSTAILENQRKPVANNQRSQLLDSTHNGLSRRLNKLSNTYHVVSSGNNEFESHRMSRMRQQGTSSAASNIVGTTTQSLSTSTSSSLNQDVNTRFVDDFMITTDRIEGNTRGSTLIPPLVISSLHRNDQLLNLKVANPADLHPKRTRGPFAFETLKTIVTEPSSTLRDTSLIELDDTVSASSQGRPERSPAKQGADQKLLVRKKLFLENGEDDELKTSPSTSPSSVTPSDVGAADRAVTLEQPSDIDGLDLRGADLVVRQSDNFGNRKPLNSSRRSHQKPISSSSNNNNVNFTLRCPHYGCKAKGSLKLTCLNYTQICDDFIDCQDESDELDCVSLLKHDSKSNKLSFSNGAGIIYLNRKGSLAPMCIDYFASDDNQPVGSSTQATTSSILAGSRDLDSAHLDRIKKQQQLIKQINTIGQYACSLQSFSRLVSVKINHHNLVDGSNLIKTSRLYHRLSIIGESDKQDER